MKTLYKNIIYVAILALCIVSFHSCSEDKTFDFPGDPYNRVYMQDKSSIYKIVQTPISTISNLDFKTSLKCTQKATESIKATVEVDNSMIAAYNKENETNYEAIPTSAVVLKNATMTIPLGKMASIDTLSISLTDDNTMLASLKNENGYLIPLRIVTAEGGDSQISTNVYTTYVVVTVTEDNINHDAEESDITGTLVADQSNWTASTNGSFSPWGSPLNVIFDGDMSSSCSIDAVDGKLHLDIDMGKQYTFGAITFYYGYDYGDWGKSEYASFTSGMTIYTSDNGTDWKSVGEVTSSSSKYCVFYAPITCQYIRLVTSSSYMQGGIFNVYEK